MTKRQRYTTQTRRELENHLNFKLREHWNSPAISRTFRPHWPYRHIQRTRQASGAIVLGKESTYVGATSLGYQSPGGGLSYSTHLNLKHAIVSPRWLALQLNTNRSTVLSYQRDSSLYRVTTVDID